MTSDALSDARSLPDLFRRSREAGPAAPAVVEDGRWLTYADLDARSGDVAGELIRRGVRPGDLVGLAVDRSAAAVVAILAILRAGAAYVPIDPGHPPDRVRLTVRDAGIRRLVGDPREASRYGLPVAAVVSPHDRFTGLDRAALPELDAGDPAYVIYTSGSTGHPKGCVVTHGNVLALLAAALPQFAIGSTDRWSMFHSCSFDFSVWEMWGALATGAAIVVVPHKTARSSDAFLRLLVDEAVTVLNQVPSVFDYLVIAHAEAGHPPLPVRQLIFGGEGIHLGTVRRFLTGLAGPHPVVVNMYGLTEATVHATIKRITDDTLRDPVASPIGVPLEHVSIELHDGAGQPVADGDPGEMWVVGDGVAAGYLNRPDLTAERFGTVPTPHGPRRYYRTGDLARRLPDGELEYVGRTDQQIKLRGHRIEPGEIEAVLRACPGVRQAAVVVVERGAGVQVLTAFLVPHGAIDLDLIRRRVVAALPTYLVPGRYLVVPELSTTASGKVDRAALRHPGEPAGHHQPRRTS